MKEFSAKNRYLLAAYEVGSEPGPIRSNEIARRLGVTPPSVNKMMKTLIADGVVNKRRYGEVRLTPEGIRQARLLQEQYNSLYTFFKTCRSEGEEAAKEDALCMLSALSPESLEGFLQLLCDNCPRNLN